MHKNTITATVTRPNNVTAYAAGDAVSDDTASPTILSFGNIRGRANGSGEILAAAMVLSTDQNPDVRLLLFEQSVTAVNDNAALTLTDAEAVYFIGWIDFTQSQSATNNKLFFTEATNLTFNCTGKHTTLYAIPVMLDAYTPTAQEIFTFRLHVKTD